jgi:hypothetical protein
MAEEAGAIVALQESEGGMAVAGGRWGDPFREHRRRSHKAALEAVAAEEGSD